MTIPARYSGVCPDCGEHAHLVRDLAAMRVQLRRIDREIARLDPPPPTTDPAAFGGLGSTAARAYQARLTPDRIHRLAVLHEERRQLAAKVAYAEGLDHA